METRELDSWPPSSSTTRFSMGRNWKSHMLENLEKRQLHDLSPSCEDIRQPGSTVSRFYSGILVHETNSHPAKIIFSPPRYQSPTYLYLPLLSLFPFSYIIFIFCPFFTQISPPSSCSFSYFPPDGFRWHFPGCIVRHLHRKDLPSIPTIGLEHPGTLNPVPTI